MSKSNAAYAKPLSTCVTREWDGRGYETSRLTIKAGGGRQAGYFFKLVKLDVNFQVVQNYQYIAKLQKKQLLTDTVVLIIDVLSSASWALIV